MVNKAALEEFWSFVAAYKPHKRIHLGDNWDTTAWRTGATSGAGGDSAASVERDWAAGEDFLLAYRPQVFFLGNHDARPFAFLNSPSALIASAAQHFVADLEKLCKKVGAEVIPYNILNGWRKLGGTAFGHGYMFNEQAARDHAEMLGCQTVIAHVHTLSQSTARFVGAPIGYSAGCLIDPQRAEYASRRRATHRWRNGWAYGEYSETECKVFLHAARVQVATIPSI